MEQGTKELMVGGAVLAAVIFGASKALHLVEKGVAGGKLDIQLVDASIKNNLASLLTLNPTIEVGLSFKINNPTAEAISFSKPSIKIFSLVGDKGKMGFSKPDASKVTVNAKSSTNLSEIVEIPSLGLNSSFPDAITYFAARILKGMQSTRKVRVDYEYDAEGITVNDSKTVSV